MVRKLTLAALVLTLGLTAAGCGSTAGAGAAASRWPETADGRTIEYQNEARGPLSDGYYSADEEGRVAGFDGRRTGTDQIGQEVRKTGQDMLQGAKDAAKNAGDMAEDAIDGAVNETKADRHIADPARN